MFSKLKKKYVEAQFNPKVLGLFINPMYFARKGLYVNVSELIPSLTGKLLDIGCYNKPYEELCNVIEYIGLEIDTKNNRKNTKADYFYDGKKMPFPDKTFDSILSNQVLEHVFNPIEFLSEINRISKIDSLFLLTVPFVWDEHSQPYDYARYSSFGLTYILKEHGFEIIEHRKSNNGIEVIFQLINAYLYKVILGKNTYLNLIFTLVFIAPFNVLGLLLSKILPKNNDLYLDNIILAKKIKDLKKERK